MVDQSGLIILPFQSSEVDELISLFRSTVHAVNRADYTFEQLNAWAPDAIDRKQWLARMTRNDTHVASFDKTCAGFAELTDEGVIHMLFVAAAYQRRGIASALYEAMENQARAAGHKSLSTYASLTARGFFSRVGFVVLRENVAEINGQHLTNFLMEKKLT